MGDVNQLVRMPSIGFQDYPVDIHIRIYREAVRHTAYISALGYDCRVSISMSAHDLESLNRQLQEEIGTVAVRQEGGKLTSSECDAELRTLAEVGHYAFLQAFGRSEAREAIQRALAAVQDYLDGRRLLSIQFASESFVLPWELLYPVPLDQLSYRRFWGMNYIISRVVVQKDRPGSFVSPKMAVGDRPRLGLLAYDELPSVSEREIPFFEKLHDAGKIAFFKMRALDPAKKREELRAFSDWWKDAFNLVHLACHASYQGDRPSQSSILLTDEFPISLMEMEAYGMEIAGHPLVILNACESGNLNPLYTANFAAAFLKYGARGVVATECAVPDNFAADFAEQLYTRLLAGDPLGETLLATRRYFLDEHNNPSGLLYSMYAPPSIRLVREGD